jgi:hypothetical protein
MSALKSYCFLNPSVQSNASSFFDEDELNLLCSMMHRTMIEKKEDDGSILRRFRFKSDKRQCAVTIAATADNHSLLLQEIQESCGDRRFFPSQARAWASSYLIWIFRLLPFVRGAMIGSTPELPESLWARPKAVLQMILGLLK